ncbi:SCO2584 family spore wall biosynthesis protein [Streptomyces sp. NPDC002596]|uniref:SCO2584 family spore wall biosynthesis protein n=1 Tax=Streptomyces sp. NPDC056227 TaxID=3345753 RepID=UPI0035D91D1F
MPDDVGGRPFPDGWEPDDDRGGADEDFASVVFDEDFVRAAAFHEPTAVERLLAAAEARAEAEAARARAGGGPGDDDFFDDGYGPGGGYGRGSPYGDPMDPDGLGDYDNSPYGRHGGTLRPYRGAARWHRPVAWLLALLMGIGMVALAFSAVYRGASANRQDQVPPPASTGVDSAPEQRAVESRTGGGPLPGHPGGPSGSADHSRPAVSAVPRTP